jgi:hypothetical protein
MKKDLEDLDQWITEIKAEAEDEDGRLGVFGGLLGKTLSYPWTAGS